VRKTLGKNRTPDESYCGQSVVVMQQISGTDSGNRCCCDKWYQKWSRLDKKKMRDLSVAASLPV
jgi:hypothetical protein